MNCLTINLMKMVKSVIPLSECSIMYLVPLSRVVSKLINILCCIVIQNIVCSSMHWTLFIGVKIFYFFYNQGILSPGVLNIYQNF
jgi:hypothetical protein